MSMKSIYLKITPDDGVTAAYQRQVPRRGEIPTAEEFVRFATQKIIDKK